MTFYVHAFVLLVACAMFGHLPAYAQSGQLNFEYKNNIEDRHQKYITLLQEAQSLQEMLAFIEESVPLQENVNVLIGADDGPLYDPQIEEIWIPTAFFEEIEQRFSEASAAATEDAVNQAVLDVTLHTLIHEVGHAFIAQYEIPTLGREEDAVDNLASVLLLEYLDDGDLVALNAANMFAYEDSDLDTLEDENFWDEHSLDIQRYFMTLCHVYGARPEDNEALVDDGELSVEKGEQCESEYEIISHNWLNVLGSVQQ